MRSHRHRTTIGLLGLVLALLAAACLSEDGDSIAATAQSNASENPHADFCAALAAISPDGGIPQLNLIIGDSEDGGDSVTDPEDFAEEPLPMSKEDALEALDAARVAIPADAPNFVGHYLDVVTGVEMRYAQMSDEDALRLDDVVVLLTIDPHDVASYVESVCGRIDERRLTPNILEDYLPEDPPTDPAGIDLCTGLAGLEVAVTESDRRDEPVDGLDEIARQVAHGLPAEAPIAAVAPIRSLLVLAENLELIRGDGADTDSRRNRNRPSNSSSTSSNTKRRILPLGPSSTSRVPTSAPAASGLATTVRPNGSLRMRSPRSARASLPTRASSTILRSSSKARPQRSATSWARRSSPECRSLRDRRVGRRR